MPLFSHIFISLKREIIQCVKCEHNKKKDATENKSCGMLYRISGGRDE